MKSHFEFRNIEDELLQNTNRSFLVYLKLQSKEINFLQRGSYLLWLLFNSRIYEISLVGFRSWFLYFCKILINALTDNFEMELWLFCFEGDFTSIYLKTRRGGQKWILSLKYSRISIEGKFTSEFRV